MTVTLTPKQREANKLLGSAARNIMLRGGSRSGKTFLFVRALVQRAINAPGSRHVIFRFRFNHAKTSVWSDTLPKVLELCFPDLSVRFDKTDFFVEVPNGSQIWIAGLDDKERVEKILGQEYSTLYFNESSQIPWGSVETAMSRLAQKCRLAPAIAAITGREFLALKAYFDCNPPSKLHWSYSLFKAKLKPGTKESLPRPDDYVEMQVNPADNADNLPEEYFDVLAGMSAAKRLRFEAGEWASEVNGALWSLEDRKAPDGKVMPGIDSQRVSSAPEMQRIVVAVDPSGTRGDGGGDDIGIVVAGHGVDGQFYVMEDGTCQLSPEGWGRRAVNLYHHHNADRIVGERNYGGDMVRFTVATADPNAAYTEVSASRGKSVRAEPVSALYEQGRVHHLGVFPDLEDQMCNFTTSGFVGEGSPDRVDALVWALTELMGGVRKVFSMPLEGVVVENFSIPAHWRRSFAFEIHGDQVAVLWFAIDPSDGVSYAYSEHDLRGMAPHAQAAAIAARGPWIPGVTAETAPGRSEKDTRAALIEMSNAGLNVHRGQHLTDTSVSIADDLLQTGRLKVFETLGKFAQQYRTYHRDEDGEIIEGSNLFMRCLRYYAASGRDLAETKPEAMDAPAAMGSAADRKMGY